MRHCVTCDANYDADPKRCPDCGARTLSDHEMLLWREKREALTNQHFVPVKILEGPADATFVREMMRESGLDFDVVVHEDDAFSAALNRTGNYGVVLVPEAQAQNARTLLRELAKAAPMDDPTDV